MMGHVATGDDHPLYIISSLSIWFLLYDLSLNSGFKLGKLEERSRIMTLKSLELSLGSGTYI